MAFVNNNPGRQIQRSYQETPSVKDNSYNLNKGMSARDFAGSLAMGAAAKMTERIVDNVGNSIDNMFKSKGGTMDSKDSNKGNNNKGNGGSGRGKQRSRREIVVSNSLFIPTDRGTTQLSLDTGIRSGAIVDTHDVGDTKYSPCYMMCGSILPIDSALGSETNAQLSDSLYHQYLTVCQSMVNYQIGSTFSQTDFDTYIRTLSAALQLYYQVDSVLAYTSDPVNNNNEGIFNLRKSITPNELSNHRELEITLGNLPCPPRLLEVIRYFYQNFKFSSNPNSAIYRLSYEGTWHQETLAQWDLDSVQQQIITDLRDPATVGNIPAILNKAFPNWSIGILPASSSDPIVDEGFKTFWHNSTVGWTSSDVEPITYTCFALNKDSQYPYFMFTDELDGVYYAMSSCSVDDVIQPGLWSPVTNPAKIGNAVAPLDKRGTLLCFSGGSQWKMPVTHGQSSQSGVYHNMHSDGSTVFERQYAHSDTSRVLWHNNVNIQEALSNVLDYLFSPQQAGF